MNNNDLMKYCHFYKGEKTNPFANDQEFEGELWVAEKMVCEEFSSSISDKNTERDVAHYVAAYVSKWDPYTFRKALEVYFEKAPRYKKEIMSIYN